MTADQALIPQVLSKNGNLISQNVLSVITGVALISLLAQLSIPLPWTPVPITGQTFGVALTSLLWGRKRAVAIMLTYLTFGSLGLPVFAMGKSGFTIGPTSGYLLGMLGASYVMGSLADLGWTKKFFQAWLVAFVGSIVVFSCGLGVLSFFVPLSKLLSLGLFPFLPGDLIKTSLAAWIVSQSQSLLEEKK